jgi:hypothetical protein
VAPRTIELRAIGRTIAVSPVRSLPRSVQVENAAGFSVVLELSRLGAQLRSCCLLRSEPQCLPIVQSRRSPTASSPCGFGREMTPSSWRKQAPTQRSAATTVAATGWDARVRRSRLRTLRPHRQVRVDLACVRRDWETFWRCVRNPRREVWRTGRLLWGRRLVQRGRSTVRLLACTRCERARWQRRTWWSRLSTMLWGCYGAQNGSSPRSGVGWRPCQICSNVQLTSLGARCDLEHAL